MAMGTHQWASGTDKPQGRQSTKNGDSHRKRLPGGICVFTRGKGLVDKNPLLLDNINYFWQRIPVHEALFPRKTTNSRGLADGALMT